MTDSISSVLSQIRAYQSQLGKAVPVGGDMARSDAIQACRAACWRPAKTGAATGTSFSETLRGAINGVSAAQRRPAHCSAPLNWASPAPTWRG